jgi:hypothetical protein
MYGVHGITDEKDVSAIGSRISCIAGLSRISRRCLTATGEVVSIPIIPEAWSKFYSAYRHWAETGPLIHSWKSRNGQATKLRDVLIVPAF